MIARDRTKRPVDVAGLARMVTQAKPPQMLPNIISPTLLSNQLRGMGACSCESGLGIFNLTTSQGTQNSVLGAVATGANFVPGVGPLASSVLSIFSSAIHSFENWLGIGAGRKEADLITPLQNEMMNRLGQITNGILLGQNPSITTLQNYYVEVWQLAVSFMEFVLQPVFTDRRASGQALNTVMPYIDGTCGYPEPLGQKIPTNVQSNCLSWGTGTVGGDGDDGMMGALWRAITFADGVVPTFPTTTMADAANNGFDVTTVPPGGGGGGILAMGSPGTVAAVIGIAALFLYSRKVRL